jgi:hypothetical protein
VAAVSVIAAILCALALAAPAVSQTPIIDAAADSFRGRSVFFLFTTDLTPAEIQGLERQIEQEARGPLYIAILPAEARREADGTTSGVALELSRRIVATNPPAVHAVVIDDEFTAVNRDIPAGDLAAEALQAHGDEPLAAVLSDFIRRVGDAREEAAAQAIAPDPAPDDDGSSDRWILAALAAIAVAVAIAALAGRRRGGIGRGG